MNVPTTPKATSHEVIMLVPGKNNNAVIQDQQQQQQSQQTLDPEQTGQQSAGEHPAPSGLEDPVEPPNHPDTVKRKPPNATTPPMGQPLKPSTPAQRNQVHFCQKN